MLNPKALHILVKNYRRNYSFLPLFILLVTAVIALSFDFYHYRNQFSLFNWICFYWPGIAVSNSMIHIANIINTATYNYQMLNSYLNQYTHKDLTPAQKFKMSEKGHIPIKLMQRFPRSRNTIYHKIFIIHDEISRVVRLINKIAGKYKPR